LSIRDTIARLLQLTIVSYDANVIIVVVAISALNIIQCLELIGEGLFLFVLA